MLTTSNAISFSEFCEKLKLHNPRLSHQPISMVLNKNQQNLFEFCENNQHIIVNKFRQGGFSTFFLAYLLWKIHTEESITCGIMTANCFSNDRFMEILAEMSACIDDQSYVCSNNGIINRKTYSKITIIHCPVNCRGRKLDYMFFDEMAFKHLTKNDWNTMWPAMVKCFIASTPHKKKGLFYRLYKNAIKKRNSFAAFECDYTEAPILNSPLKSETHGKFINEYPEYNNITNKFLKHLVKTGHFHIHQSDHIRSDFSMESISIKHLAKALAGLVPLVGKQDAFRMVFNAVTTHFFGGNSDSSISR